MAPQQLTMSAGFLATVRGLRELHQLTAAGRLDSPEADAVRDATDAPWEALTETEKKRVGGLSEDLYSITEPARTAVKELNPQAQARLVDIYQARQRGEWDRVFELLRRWKAYLDPSLLSYLRGSTWLEAGDPATAAIFYEHASELQPDNGNYLAFYLNTLHTVAPSEATRRAEEILQSPDNYPPVVVATAANVVFDPAKELPEAESALLFRRLIPILGSTLHKIEKGDEAGVDGSTFSMTCALLGFCHEFLGENQAALGYYSKGLTANPTNDALLVARGILLYGESPRAIDDFRLAIKHGSPVDWPFFFLAHHYVVTGQFEQGRLICERGLEIRGSDAVKSELAEWLAISQSELGFPIDIVRGSFDASIRYDPSNERARRNFAAFEAATRPTPVGVYETRTSVAVRASGLSERRLRRAA
jgi:tetratricopeptide (TPR) repeat protein